MIPENHRQLTPSEQAQLDDALAALLASTRRTKRNLNLIKVGEKLRIAVRLLGSIRAVADALGLSDETVRQFGRVEKLSPKVKNLLSKGQITSMDLADRLSRFSFEDQNAIAEAVVSGRLDANDVRGILALRKATPKESIDQLIRRIQSSRNIKEYVAEFLVPHPTPSAATLIKRLSPVIARHDIRNLEVTDNGVGRLFLNANGKKALESAAREERLTKGELLQRLLKGEMKPRGR